MDCGYGRLLALDIGGTLAKMCFIRNFDEDSPMKKAQHIQNLRIQISETQYIQFKLFKSTEIHKVIDYIGTYFKDYTKLALTGGGSCKYLDQIKDRTKLQVVPVEQFESLLQGIELIRGLKIADQFFSVKGKQISSHPVSQSSFYPFMIVNVGSGVSILKVYMDEQKKVQSTRIGGTCLGGGFFLGLSQILTNTNSFTELLQLAEKGHNSQVDIVPGDFEHIGKSLPQLQDAPVLISLGKLGISKKRQDIARGLFLMVAYNLAQISLLHSNLNGLQRVVFTGFFCRNNTFMIDCFQQAFSFFQKEQTQVKYAFGLKHDGYLGVLGSLNTLIQMQKK